MRGMSTVVLVALSCAVSQGCFPAQPQLTPAQQLDQMATIQVTDDPYQDHIKYMSGLGSEGVAGRDYTVWAVLGVKSRKSPEALFYVQWRNSYFTADWRFYFRASDAGANELKIEEVKSDVENCSSSGACFHEERFNIFFSLPQMTAGRTAGISFKMYARDGSSKVVSVHPRVVDSLLRKMGY